MGSFGFEFGNMNPPGVLLSWPRTLPSACCSRTHARPQGLDLQRALAQRADALPGCFYRPRRYSMSVLAIKRGAVDFLTKRSSGTYCLPL